MAFRYRGNQLYCEDVNLSEVASAAGTPCYVYSRSMVEERYRAYDSVLGDLPHTICYAVKANSNVSLLRLMLSLGSGFDIVSGGELFRVLKAGGDPAKVVFSGVGKTPAEIDYALESGIFSFNCESEAEIGLIDELAAHHGAKARVALRVNPDVDAFTHPYISTGLREHKFGVDIADAESVYARAQDLRNIALDAVSCHIGSQLLDASPVFEAIEKMLGLVERLRARGIAIRHLDLGGGLGVAYRGDDQAPAIAEFAARVRTLLCGRDLHVMVEPGRSIVGEAGVLLSRVLYRKRNGEKEFVIVDAAMNDLMRPALYHAHHEIIPLCRDGREDIRADVVGPVCESADFLARDRLIADVQAGDAVAVCTAGAYGFVLSSNYNSRPRAPEVLVEGGHWRVIRKRETFEDLISGE
jgi:diaminopimelate decarboxylase